MIVGYDAKRAFHNDSGLGNYSRSLIRAIQKTRREASYVLFNPKTPVKFSDFYNPAISTVIEPKGIYSKAHPYWRSFKIADKFDELGIDVYHGLSGEIPSNIKRNVLSVVTIHDIIFIRFPELYAAADRFIYKKKLFSAIKHADIIVATSEQTKNDLIELCHAPSEKIHVIYQTCQDIFFEAGKAKKSNYLENPYFLSVGAITPRKNFEELIKAMAKVDGARLIIAGRDTPHRAKLEKLCNDLNLSEKVVFRTDVNEQEMAGLYRDALAFVYASKFEGFGIPLLEAQAAGCPVIAANVSCLPEIAGPHSALFNLGDKEQLIKSMNEFLNEPNLRSKKSEEGLSFAAQFKAPKLAEELMSLYEKNV